MKFYLIAFFLLCCPFFPKTQGNIDALRIIWEDESNTDTIRLEAFNKVCSTEFLLSKPDSGLLLAQMAFDYAKEKDLKKEMATALECMGFVYMNLADYDRSIDLQNQSVQISESINDYPGLLKALNALGNVYLKKSDYANAIGCYFRGLTMAEQQGYKKHSATFLNNIGLVYMDLDNQEESLAYLSRASALQKEVGNVKSESNTLVNIGTIYRQKREYQKALTYYKQSLNLKKTNNIQYGLSTCYSNIGLIHQALGEPQQALSYFKQSMALHQKAGDKKGIANCLIHFGSIYQLIDRDSTIAMANEALSIAQEVGSREEIRDAAELLYETFYKDGQYKLALNKYQLFRDTKDSIYSARNQKAVLINEFQYKAEKKELENRAKYEKQLLEQQLRNQRERFVGFSLFILLLLAAGYYFRRSQTQIVKERKNLHHKLKLLKDKLAYQSVASTEKGTKFTLDRTKIETAFNTKLGESAWMILNLIFDNPSLSNKEIAKEVSLSVEGVSSSLRRMYATFNIEASSNKKIALIRKIVEVSIGD